MNRKKIILISVLMSCALIGVIAMQVNWILHDYRVKEEQFNRQVNDAMMTVVSRLETREAYKLISNSFITLNDDSIFSLMRQSSSRDKKIKSPHGSGIPEPPAPPEPPEITGENNTNVNYEPLLPPDYPEPLQEDYNDEIRMEVTHMAGRKITIRHNQHIITIDQSPEETTVLNESDDANEITALDERQREKIESKVATLQSVMNKMAFEFM